ncbi:hypothetical protein Rin_00011890 [Candidatus Regiella insecticola 5.15]|uniref:DUF484 domain-containing protein n=1 Tax=Candidatus Regiella insecticola 5.15 TaxID=1005043 RepID=G2GZH2_9ENTR|nr:hypothetical protein Rin_00011890 [Candidatus Regiella insecticola 5.15]
MSNYKKQVISNTELNDDEVMQYLLKNPNFFMRNADLVKKMRIPQAMQGNISLVEWQLHRQRRQISQLQEEITLLMEYAGLNEILCKRFFQLQANLALASTLPEMLKRLQCWAKTFGLLGTQVRLFSDRWQVEKFSDLPHLAMLRSDFEPLRRQYLLEKQHFLGSLSESELRFYCQNLTR